MRENARNTATPPLRVALIAPGSGGGFYCENCLRDYPFARELGRLGHHALLVPVYLPALREERSDAEMPPIFLGGINLFLRQKWPGFRRAPSWLRRALDAPWLLRLTSRWSRATRARDLGQTTLSLLRDAEALAGSDLDRIAAWLLEQGRPNVVHLSNALLLGLAPGLRARIGCAVVCSLQDEDAWVDAMGEPWAEACWNALRERAAEAVRFVAVSRHYANRLAPRLSLRDDQLCVVHPGVDRTGYVLSSRGQGPPVIGFLARMSRANGLDLLVEAVLRLRRNPRWRDLRLVASGGTTADDRPLLRDLRRRIAREGAQNAVRWEQDFTRPARQRFLSSLTVLCVPTRESPAVGFWALEAMASGVPVVAPRRGGLPEMVESWAAGVLYDPDDPEGLIEALSRVLSTPDEAAAMGRRGRQAVETYFTLERMAQEAVAVYREALAVSGMSQPSGASAGERQ